MRNDPKLGRRGFVKLCASAIAMVSASPKLLAQGDATLRRFSRVKLVGNWGRPIKYADLKVGENHVFFYPFATTPCFLVNLGKPTEKAIELKTEAGQTYRWRGGVGPRRSLVAFSAICAHRMTHPTRSVNFINYRHEPVRFQDKKRATAERAQVIYCCSERSVYDPANGARVIGGPAPQPLAAILLEYEEHNDNVYASGIYGGNMFDKFFDTFRVRLELEHLTSDIQTEVVDTATVVPVAEYCQTQVLC